MSRGRSAFDRPCPCSRRGGYARKPRWCGRTWTNTRAWGARCANLCSSSRRWSSRCPSTRPSWTFRARRGYTGCVPPRRLPASPPRWSTHSALPCRSGSPRTSSRRRAPLARRPAQHRRFAAHRREGLAAPLRRRGRAAVSAGTRARRPPGASGARGQKHFGGNHLRPRHRRFSPARAAAVAACRKSLLAAQSQWACRLDRDAEAQERRFPHSHPGAVARAPDAARVAHLRRGARAPRAGNGRHDVSTHRHWVVGPVRYRWRRFRRSHQSPHCRRRAGHGQAAGEVRRRSRGEGIGPRGRRGRVSSRWTKAARVVLDFGQSTISEAGGPTMRPTTMIGTLACAAMVGMMSAAPAQTALKVIVFPGLSNFSIYAAQHKNLFAKHHLAIELIYTPNSTVLREGLAKGDYQIAHAGVDNSVAMVELAKADAIIVAGGDNGFNHIFVQPEINAYTDLRGTLLLCKVLKDNGLNKSDYVIKPVGATIARLEAMTKDKANAAADVLNPPFTFLARDAGLKDMGATAKAIGAYQSDGVVVMRDWARANSDTLVRYLSALIEGRRWALDPANKEQAIALLAERLKLTPQIAAQAYAVATDPVEGMAKDAQLDMAGFRNVLKLRAEIEDQWGGNAPPPDKYLDLSYYERALSAIR